MKSIKNILTTLSFFFLFFLREIVIFFIYFYQKALILGKNTWAINVPGIPWVVVFLNLLTISRVCFFSHMVFILSLSDCPSGYNSEGDSCYKFFSDPATGDAAQSQCESDGGNLVNIGSDAENAYVKSLFK